MINRLSQLFFVSPDITNIHIQKSQMQMNYTICTLQLMFPMQADLYMMGKQINATKIGYKHDIFGLPVSFVRYVAISGQVPPNTVAAMLIPAEMPENLHVVSNDSVAIAASGPT